MSRSHRLREKPLVFNNMCKSTRFIHLLCFCLLAQPIASASAESASEYQSRLDQIRSKIGEVVSSLRENKSRRDTLRDDLKKLEVKIAKAARELRNNESKHKKSTQNLEKSRQELKKLQKNLQKQKQLLAAQIRSAYAMGQQPQLKMLLNQQDPAQMGRAMTYYSYLNRARGEEIQRFLDGIAREQALQTEIAEVTEELKRLVISNRESKQRLSKHRNERKALLVKLNQDIDHQQLTLKELESSRNRIENLLESLGELLADIPAGPLNQKPFAQLKGALPWPTAGEFRIGFGGMRSQGGLKWNGVVINADYGTPVRAVANGRVVFADWLQGYGFITIIDHNDGFMSLYGFAQELYKDVGDWIEASEVIASVGDSGGQSRSGLYFEIRKQGKPVNPSQWCSSKVRHVALQENE
jgi:septal ring factor EnvC (AmiA/AmiB activator)